MSLPVAEIQRLDPSAVLHLFVLDATVCGGGVTYWAMEPNITGAPIIWQGQAYQPIPMTFEGFEWSSKGTLPRPKLTISNLDGAIGAMAREFDDLVGAKVTLRRTFARFMDSDNFPAPAGDLGWGLGPWGDTAWGGSGFNPSADPEAGYVDEPWFVERKISETPTAIEFELCTPMDQQNAMVPKRRVTANVCGWQDAAVCPFSVGGLCAKTLPACRDHAAGDGAALAQFTGGLPFGAFVGTARVR